MTEYISSKHTLDSQALKSIKADLELLFLVEDGDLSIWDRVGRRLGQPHPILSLSREEAKDFAHILLIFSNKGEL